MQGRRRRVLCAEAHKDICDLIILLLERKGYQVKGAQTIAEALALAGSEHFDLYIVNDKYIDGDSLDLCAQLRSITPETGVLLFTLDSSDHSRQIFDSSKKHYVSKTSDFVSLVETIDALFQKS